MLLWSMITTTVTDPGRVPLYWGYFLDDPDQRRRRYCLICHIFKPERCHHCSACNRCVLNMDHHCPWINNCVGFFNRKFFLLMLFYVIITALTVAFGMLGDVLDIFYDMDNYIAGNKSIEVFWFGDFLIIVGYVLNIISIVVITLFFKFHFELILNNSTTLENLDKKRLNKSTVPRDNHPDFNMGNYYNWVQVFGKNEWLWPFPIFFESGKPVGDGILWPQRAIQRQQESDNQETQSGNNINNTNLDNSTKYVSPNGTSRNINNNIVANNTNSNNVQTTQNQNFNTTLQNNAALNTQNNLHQQQSQEQQTAYSQSGQTAQILDSNNYALRQDQQNINSVYQNGQLGATYQNKNNINVMQSQPVTPSMSMNGVNGISHIQAQSAYQGKVSQQTTNYTTTGNYYKNNGY